MNKLLQTLYLGCVLVAAMSFESTAAQTLENGMKDHPSPYLAAHANDEVRWQTWSQQAFEHAKQRESLLLVSVGYFACHWCHVMQRESFKSGPAAALINEMSIPIKVDRELRPELDAHLMAFSERTTGAAGWPLQVLLTPDGYPLFAFGYQPQADLVRLLTAARQQWAKDKKTLRDVARHAHLELTKSLAGGAAFALTQGNTPGAYNALVTQIMEVADPLSGGFGQQSKFPSTPQLDALIYAESVTSDPERRMFLLMTLHQMAALGLRDQVGGGFFRYVTDPSWTTPHFEKMLYDNALLARTYAKAADALDIPALTQVAFDTVQFMFRDLWHPKGGFIASLSAEDESGVEGRPYVLSVKSAQKELTADEWKVVQMGWGLSGPGGFEEGHLPMQSAQPQAISQALGIPIDTVRAQLTSAREKLLAARASLLPPRDEKRIAAWNGLGLSAVAGVYSQLSVAEKAKGGDVARLLADELWSDGTLARARARGTEKTAANVGEGNLSDYAHTARGLLDWARVTAEARYASVAADIALSAWRRFRVDAQWRSQEQSIIALAPNQVALADRALPSASATLLDVLDELIETGDARAVAIEAEVFSARATLPQQAISEPFFYATQIANAHKRRYGLTP